MVDDDEDDALLVRNLLARAASCRLDLTAVTDFDEGLERYRAGDWDAVIVDHRLGPRTGIELLQEVRAREGRAAFVMLTGQDDPVVISEAIRHGVSDFLRKGHLTAPGLEASVLRAIEIKGAEWSAAHLRAVVSSARDAITSETVDGRLISWNAGAEALFGYAPAEMIGESASRLLPTGREREAEDLAARVMSGESVVDLETVRRRKDGSLVPVSISASQIVDAAGAVIGISVVARDLTSRHAEVRRELLGVLDTLGTTAAVTDATGRILDVNRAWRATTEQCGGDTGAFGNYLDVCDRAAGPDAEVARAAADQIRAVLRGELPSGLLEYPCHSPDARRWFTMRAARWGAAGDGQVLITHEDITARVLLQEARERQAQAEKEHVQDALRESEHRFLTAFQAAPIGMALLTLEGRLMLVNEALCTIVSMDPEELSGMTHLELTHPDDAATEAKALAKLLGGETAEYRMEKRYRSRERGYVWVEATTTVVRNGDDAPLYLIMQMQDISARREAEEERERLLLHNTLERSRLHAIFESSPVAIISVDESGSITHCSQAIAAVCGVPPEAAVGRRLSDHLPQLGPAVSATLRGAILDPLDVEYRGPSGELFHWQVSSAPIRVSETESGGAVFLVEEVTERRQREVQLRRAERLASVGSLIGGVAHELNNPLMGIKSVAQLALADPHDQDVPEYLQTIEREASRAARVVTELRTLVANTRDDTMVGDVDVNEVVRRAVESRSYVHRTRNLEIRLSLESGLGTIRAERTQIEQIVMNLLVNAEDALRDPGQGEIELRTWSGSSGVGLEVRDSGPGIPPEIIERIFDPFFTTKDPGQGMGLGLSIVLRTVNGLGGSMSVESPPQGGARFRVELPAHRPHPTVAAEHDSTTTPAVLVVDDEESIRGSLARYLRRKGYLVDTAADVRTALERVRARSYQLILTDIRMPGGDGRDLVEELRRSAVGGAAHVVVMTGDAESLQIGRYRHLDVGAVLLKPFDLSELDSRLPRLPSM